MNAILSFNETRLNLKAFTVFCEHRYWKTSVRFKKL